MTITINLSMPSDLLKLVDKQAKSEHRTRSDFFRDAVREHILREQKWKSLQRYGAVQLKKAGIRTEEDVVRVIHEFRKEQRALKSKR